MSAKRKGKLKVDNEDRIKFYHNINELHKMAKKHKEKKESSSPEKKKKAFRGKFPRRKNPVQQNVEGEINMSTEISFVTEADVIYEVDRIIHKFFFKDTGFKKVACALGTELKAGLVNASSVSDIYMLAYCNRIFLLEAQFKALKEELKDTDPNKVYGDYSDNLLYAVAEKFVERIKSDGLDNCEGVGCEDYYNKILLYTQELNDEVNKLYEGQDF